MVPTPLDSSAARIKAWLKIGLCLLGYFAVFEAVVTCETRRLLSYSEARSLMVLFTAAMLFLAAAYLHVVSKGFRGFWLIIPSAICYTAAWAFVPRPVLLVATFIALGVYLLAIFNPFGYKHEPLKS